MKTISFDLIVIQQHIDQHEHLIIFKYFVFLGHTHTLQGPWTSRVLAGNGSIHKYLILQYPLAVVLIKWVHD